MPNLSGLAYKTLRNFLRPLIIENPSLDRYLGWGMRRLERRLKLYRLLQPSASGSISCHGIKLNYRPEDMGVVSTLLLYGDYETETRELILDVLKPGMTFVDLGAHLGYFSLIAAKIVTETGGVFAFEPTPTTRTILERNIVDNNLGRIIQVCPYAITDSERRVFFDVTSQSSTSNRIASTAGDKSVELEGTSIDGYFEEQGWPSVDLIKMDIEGHELEGFRGMRELSDRNPQLKLIFEYHPATCRDQEDYNETMFSALKELGFNRFYTLHRARRELRVPEDFSYLKIMATQVNANIFAIK